jgi:hypothetical protein
MTKAQPDLICGLSGREDLISIPEPEEPRTLVHGKTQVQGMLERVSSRRDVLSSRNSGIPSHWASRVGRASSSNGAATNSTDTRVQVRKTVTSEPRKVSQLQCSEKTTKTSLPAKVN